MKVPLKLALPSIMGLLFATLMFWDLYNQRVIRSVGMGWDTGAPLWPFQTPDTLLFALNLPAFVFSHASARYLRFGNISPISYVLFAPATVAWWWLVGVYLDRRVTRASGERTPVRGWLLCILAVGLFTLGIEEFRWAFRWWWTYWRSVLSVTDLILLRLLAPSLWCGALGLVAASAALRRLQSRGNPIRP